MCTSLDDQALWIRVIMQACRSVMRSLSMSMVLGPVCALGLILMATYLYALQGHGVQFIHISHTNQHQTTKPPHTMTTLYIYLQINSIITYFTIYAILFFVCSLCVCMLRILCICSVSIFFCFFITSVIAKESCMRLQ